MSLEGLKFSLAEYGIRLADRLIDDSGISLAPDLVAPLARRRASGAARLAARECLRALNGPANAPLPRAPGRFPVWPEGFIGSLAHDDTLAVAAVARACDLAALGVDVEPVEELPNDVAEFALSTDERGMAVSDPPLARAIFAAKEAVYKAVNPYDGTPLEYDDIAVDFVNGVARLRDGRSLRLISTRETRWILVAFGRHA